MDVAAARDMHQTIISQLMSGPGDSQRAMHEADRKLGLSYWRQWNLRHKRRASPQFIAKIRLAYLSLLEQSVRRDLLKLKTEQTALGAKDDAGLGNLVAEAEMLLAKIKERRGVG